MLERTRFFSALLCLSEDFGHGGTWGLPEGAERLGFTNSSTSTGTPSTLILDVAPLDDDLSSVEDAVLGGPAEPLEAVSEGSAEPLEAVLEGSAVLLIIFTHTGGGGGGGGHACYLSLRKI